MKVAVVAEYYPRAADPVLGVWAHRQALAARDAGRGRARARPPPPGAARRRAAKRRDLGALRTALASPATPRSTASHVDYVPLRRPAARAQLRALGRVGRAARSPARCGALREEFPFDLVHAHYAVPAGDAVRRAARPATSRWWSPSTAATCSTRSPRERGRARGGAATRSRAPGSCSPTARGPSGAAATLGARETRVVHLGTDVPAHAAAERRRSRRSSRSPTSIARKRHADVLRALWLCASLPGPALRRRRRRPGAPGARAPGRASSGVADRVEFRGQLPPAEARAAAQAATLFVLPSVDEAFGVAYVEAMAGGVPAIGRRGEGGPEEIAAAGGGHARSSPRATPRRSPARSSALLADPNGVAALGAEARATVERVVHLGALRRRHRRGLRARRCDEARPLRHRPGAARSGSEPFAAARRGARTCTSRSSAGARATAPRRRRSCPFPHSHPSQREIARARRLGRLPRRRVRHRRARRAARRLPRRAPRRASRSCSGRRCGRTRAPRARAGGLAAHAPRLPPRRRGRHLRPARERLRPPPRRADRARSPPGGRQRVVARRAFSPEGHAHSPGCLSAGWRGKREYGCYLGPGAPQAFTHPKPRWCWSAVAPSEPGPPPPARSGRGSTDARAKCATSTRPRRCRRTVDRHARRSASRGGSSSTKP